MNTTRPNWKLILHGANAEPVSPVMPYASVAVSSLTSLTDYATTSVFILAPNQSWSMDIFEFIGNGGNAYARNARRDTYEIECYPFRWNSASTQEYAELDSLASLIASKRFLWARIEAPPREYPSTAAHAMPIDVISFESSLDKTSAWKTLTLGIRHRART